MAPSVLRTPRATRANSLAAFSEQATVYHQGTRISFDAGEEVFAPLRTGPGETGFRHPFAFAGHSPLAPLASE